MFAEAEPRSMGLNLAMIAPPIMLVVVRPIEPAGLTHALIEPQWLHWSVSSLGAAYFVTLF
jgi:hypothetical protein